MLVVGLELVEIIADELTLGLEEDLLDDRWKDRMKVWILPIQTFLTTH